MNNIYYLDTIYDPTTRFLTISVHFEDGSIHKEYKKIPHLYLLVMDLEVLISAYHVFACIRWGATDVYH